VNLHTCALLNIVKCAKYPLLSNSPIRHPVRCGFEGRVGGQGEISPGISKPLVLGKLESVNRHFLGIDPALAVPSDRIPQAEALRNSCYSSSFLVASGLSGKMDAHTRTMQVDCCIVACKATPSVQFLRECNPMGHARAKRPQNLPKALLALRYSAFCGYPLAPHCVQICGVLHCAVRPHDSTDLISPIGN
jgi:hypothetical protein